MIHIQRFKKRVLKDSRTVLRENGTPFKMKRDSLETERSLHHIRFHLLFPIEICSLFAISLYFFISSSSCFLILFSLLLVFLGVSFLHYSFSFSLFIISIHYFRSPSNISSPLNSYFLSFPFPAFSVWSMPYHIFIRRFDRGYLLVISLHAQKANTVTLHLRR